jgi:hypothetical protein
VHAHIISDTCLFFNRCPEIRRNQNFRQNKRCAILH